MSDKKKREALTSQKDLLILKEQRLKIARLQEELAEAQLELEMMVGNAQSGGALGGEGVSSFQGFHHLLNMSTPIPSLMIRHFAHSKLEYPRDLQSALYPPPPRVPPPVSMQVNNTRGYFEVYTSVWSIPCSIYLPLMVYLLLTPTTCGVYC
jgi:hypothetical protein